MCGIAGAFGPAAPNSARLEDTLARMSRRGPDANGVFQGTLGGRPLTLLHSRLSIIDLDARSNQPYAADNCQLIFNGEIYNYVELRDELVAAGCRFRTDSDTEVIIQAYLHYGPDCVDHFEGMWAFALADMRDGTLLISRDRFGEKPLYLTTIDGTLYFASEVKMLAALSGRRPAADWAQVRRYLVNGYKALYKQPASFFEGVSELPAGHNAIVREPASFVSKPYWNLSYSPQPMTLDDAVAGVRERLGEALRIRLRSDVPLAFCLSGGLDSTALAALATRQFEQQVDAFSIVDSDPRYNELENMSATVEALGCRHHVIHTVTDGFFERMEALVAYHDAPVATISYYVHSYLSEAIAEAGFKVAMSGAGADELFTGYYDHYAFWLAEMSGSPGFDGLLSDWRQGYGSFVTNPVLQDPMVFQKRPDERGHIYLNRDLFNNLMTEPLEENFFEANYSSSLLRNRMLNELKHEVVPVILKEDDLNSMYFSIENRSPFLDRQLAEFLFSVPGEHLIHDGFAKYLLRAAIKGLVPESVRLDKRKRGFNASIDSLVDRTDPRTRERLLAPGPIFDIVRRDRLEAFLDGDMTDNSFSKFLFSFISARLFLDSVADVSTEALRA
jgi:asparagine synthase (glutamine-hydrolysing)